MSLDIFKQYATDESLENNGTWFEIGSDTEILVARSGNRKYAKMLTKEVERNRKVLDVEDDFADAKSDEIMVNVMAETILLGWKNMTFKGVDLHYNSENAKKVLALKDFRKLVAEKSIDTEAYRVKLEEKQGEAYGLTSRGNWSGVVVRCFSKQ